MSEREIQATSRRNAVRKMFQGAGFFGLGGMLWGAYINESKGSELILRPPGAIPEDEFIKSCIKCGACVEACPYDTLVLAEPNNSEPVGTPYFKPRQVPCYMCPDIPCVPVCPTSALDKAKVSTQEEGKEPELDINKSQMGLAVVDKESCIAFWGIQCDVCYRACPLLDVAITLDYERNERTGKHAFLRPSVNSNACTGCGLCEHACVVEKAAIFILPRKLAMGKVGDHYIKGWDKNDEKRLEEIRKKDEEEAEGAIDYLNDMEGLLDE